MAMDEVGWAVRMGVSPLAVAAGGSDVGVFAADEHALNTHTHKVIQQKRNSVFIRCFMVAS
jgi:hypothetical protein